jgi:hypothetical protein
MQFHRLNTILVRDTHRSAEAKWRTVHDLEVLYEQIPKHHLRRRFAVAKAIRTYRKSLTK